MVEQQTRTRVDEFWASTLDFPVADVHAGGVRVRANPPSRADWRGIYVLGFEGATVFAPADQLDKVSSAVTGLAADQLLMSRTWQDILGGNVQTMFGPVRHFYLDSADGLAEVAQGRRLNPTDSDALSALRSAVPPQEWLVTGFTAAPALLFGIFEGETLVAAANLTPGPDAATDVGIVIHPDARGRGLGTRVAALAARQAIVMHGVARYRVLTSSPSTVAIADRLGFEEYGSNLVAYLNDHPSSPDRIS
jgi:GNAT superfamily N-acetyltransferase